MSIKTVLVENQKTDHGVKLTLSPSLGCYWQLVKVGSERVKKYIYQKSE